MFELSDEKTLMTSDDGTVKLTTHRIIYQIEKTRHHLMLEDFESCELKKLHIGNYKSLTIIFSILTVVIVVIKITEYFNYPKILRSAWPTLVPFLYRSFAVDLALFLSFVSLLFFLLARRYGLRINTVWSVLEDKTGNIWFGTRHKGLWRYNGKTYTDFTEKEELGKSIYSVTSIIEDKTGNIWFAEENTGVWCYDGTSFKKFYHE